MRSITELTGEKTGNGKMASLAATNVAYNWFISTYSCVSSSNKSIQAKPEFQLQVCCRDFVVTRRTRNDVYATA
jgi:hypothetical protein